MAGMAGGASAAGAAGAAASVGFASVAAGASLAGVWAETAVGGAGATAPTGSGAGECQYVGTGGRVMVGCNILDVASLTSATGAASSFLGSSCAGAAAAGAGTGAAAGAGAGADTGAVPVDAGAVSLLAGSGAVAGAGAAGVVSVGFVVLEDGCSVVAVGAASSFLAFFLPNMPLKAFFSWSIASGAIVLCQFSSI